MKRATVKTLFFVTTLSVLLLGGCRPDYPNCKNDDDCHAASHLNDVCVNGLCQECRDDSQCIEHKGNNYYCNGGRCDEQAETAVGGCVDDSSCEPGQRCEDSVCTDVDDTRADGETCADSSQCASSSTCKGGICVAQLQALSDRCRLYLQVANHPKPFNGEVIRFGFNTYRLSTTARKKLQEVADCMEQASSMLIEIEGHTDDRGTQEYNLALGEKRANSVKDYLDAIGVDQKRLSTRSKGENEPICDETSEECWERNRRVIFIYSSND